MSIDAVHISALEALGYTEAEARFLYLVATHSGYFLARQFLGFVGGHPGKLFWTKLESNRHARSGSMAKNSAVYHLFAQKLYRQLGRENLRHHQRHEREYIEKRIAVLDFVLANPTLSYLETETDKVSFFCHRLKIEARHLPSQPYFGRRPVEPTVRCFLDRFPMFFEESPPTSPIVTFSFLQGSEASLAAFLHHLEAYLPLFRELREFRFLYLARIDALFSKARDLFHAVVTVPLEPNPAGDLLRYFAIRKAWDLHQYGSLSVDDLAFRNTSKERFAGERFEHLYRAWKAGCLPESHIRSTFRGHHLPHTTHFEARIVEPFPLSRQGKEEALAKS